MSNIVMLTIGVITQFFFGVISVLPLVLLYFLDVKFCKSNSFGVMMDISKQVRFSASWKNAYPDGFVFGCSEPLRFAFGWIPINLDKCFVGYVDWSTPIVCAFACTQFMIQEKLLKNPDEQEDSDVQKVIPIERKIRYFLREGTFSCLSYLPVDFEVIFTPNPNQTIAIEQIEAHISQNCTTSVILHGPTGSGKSLIPILLAKKMGMDIVADFNPTDPGDSIVKLLHFVKKSSKKLIIVLEEFDIMLTKIHNEDIFTNKDIPIAVKNKKEWNSFLDGFDRRFYQGVILIMTTNKDMSYFDDMDPSYLRKGRVDLKILVEPSDQHDI